jgi:hypothetical protein
MGWLRFGLVGQAQLRFMAKQRAGHAMLVRARKSQNKKHRGIRERSLIEVCQALRHIETDSLRFHVFLCPLSVARAESIIFRNQGLNLCLHLPLIFFVRNQTEERRTIFRMIGVAALSILLAGPAIAYDGYRTKDPILKPFGITSVRASFPAAAEADAHAADPAPGA